MSRLGDYISILFFAQIDDPLPSTVSEHEPERNLQGTLPNDLLASSYMTVSPSSSIILNSVPFWAP